MIFFVLAQLLMPSFSGAETLPVGFEELRVQMVQKAEAELEILKKNITCLKASSSPSAMVKCGEERNKAAQAIFLAEQLVAPSLVTAEAARGAANKGSLVLPRFDPGAFEDALNAGDAVALVFSKIDSPVCLRQALAFRSLLEEKQYRGVRVFQAELLKTPELAKRFRVSNRSTILFFKGGKERVRMFNTTEPAALREGLNRVR